MRVTTLELLKFSKERQTRNTLHHGSGQNMFKTVIRDFFSIIQPSFLFGIIQFFVYRCLQSDSDIDDSNQNQVDNISAHDLNKGQCGEQRGGNVYDSNKMQGARSMQLVPWRPTASRYVPPLLAPDSSEIRIGETMTGDSSESNFADETADSLSQNQVGDLLVEESGQSNDDNLTATEIVDSLAENHNQNQFDDMAHDLNQSNAADTMAGASSQKVFFDSTMIKIEENNHLKQTIALLNRRIGIETVNDDDDDKFDHSDTVATYVTTVNTRNYQLDGSFAKKYYFITNVSITSNQIHK